MEREFTQSDLGVFEQAEKALRENGFNVDHEPGATHNANLIRNYFETNLTVPVSLAAIYGYINAKKADFIWRTPAQQKFDKAVASTDAAQVNAIHAWIVGPQRILVKSGEEYFENIVLLIQALRGRSVSSETIHQAIGRIQNQNGRLHFQPTENQDSYLNNPYRHTVEPADRKEDENSGYTKGGRKNHASKVWEEKPRSGPEPEPYSEYKKACDLIVRNGSHGQQQALRETLARTLAEGKSYFEACHIVSALWEEIRRGSVAVPARP